jgi:hypothetical protein
MKIKSIAYGILVSASAFISSLPVAPVAHAAGLSTNCSPMPNGFTRCTQKFCGPGVPGPGGCTIVDVWWVTPEGAIVHE